MHHLGRNMFRAQARPHQTGNVSRTRRTPHNWKCLRTRRTPTTRLFAHTHLVAMLRLSSMCKCGCRGYNSIRPVLRFLRWSLRARAAGVDPVTDWEGKPWDSTSWRHSKGGQPLEVVGGPATDKGRLGRVLQSLLSAHMGRWAPTLLPLPLHSGHDVQVRGLACCDHWLVAAHAI